MVTITSHHEKMSDKKVLDRKLSPEFTKKRADHLQKLHPIEDLIRNLAPLPVSYDVGRTQPPYFAEYTYTELMGCIYLAPQSSELAARVIQYSIENDMTITGFNVAESIMQRQSNDKYKLNSPAATYPERVIFPTGSNIFAEAVSREIMTYQMHTYSDTMIKPHPLTLEETVRIMGQMYGYHRILNAQDSGWEYLQNAKTVITTASSEMGLYALLLGKELINVTNFAFEARASYSPIYRTLWQKSTEEAAAELIKIINSPYSGILHPDDPDLEYKIKEFFKVSMALREPFKPLMREYDPHAYGAMIVGKRPMNQVNIANNKEVSDVIPISR